MDPMTFHSYLPLILSFYRLTYAALLFVDYQGLDENYTVTIKLNGQQFPIQQLPFSMTINKLQDQV